MTSPGMDRSQGGNPLPVSVNVNNFPEAKRTRVTTTTTIVLDPAGGPNQTVRQICSYEPSRLRTVIHVLDAPCVLVIGESPRGVATTVVGSAPDQGRVLPNQAQEYELYGPDEMWLLAVAAAVAGRVTVTKEYL